MPYEIYRITMICKSPWSQTRGRHGHLGRHRLVGDRTSRLPTALHMCMLHAPAVPLVAPGEGIIGLSPSRRSCSGACARPGCLAGRPAWWFGRRMCPCPDPSQSRSRHAATSRNHLGRWRLLDRGTRWRCSETSFPPLSLALDPPQT